MTKANKSVSVTVSTETVMNLEPAAVVAALRDYAIRNLLPKGTKPEQIDVHVFKSEDDVLTGATLRINT